MSVPIFLVSALSGTGRLLHGLPGAFSSPGCTAPTLSAFLHRRGVPSFWSFLWPCSGNALTGPCLSCAEGSRAGRCAPGEEWRQRSVYKKRKGSLDPGRWFGVEILGDSAKGECSLRGQRERETPVFYACGLLKLLSLSFLADISCDYHNIKF